MSGRFFSLVAVVAVFVLGPGLAGCSGSDEPAAPADTTPADTTPEIAVTTEEVLPRFDGPARRALRREVARADREGMNPEVFAKVGDSNTEWPQNLYGLGCREVDFGANRELRPVVARYTRVEFPGLEPLPECPRINPLSRQSAATVSGVWTEWLMTPISRLPETGIAYPRGECRPRQTPLDCEIRLLSPRWTLIMSGSNDALLGRPLGETYRRHLTAMVDRVRRLGPVPVLSTLPPMMVAAHNGEPGEERVAEANRIIREVAEERQVPLIDLYAALSAEGMENQGLAADGLHLGAYGGDYQADIVAGSAVLTEDALRFGANRRNLIWLETLARLDRVAGAGN